MYEHEYGAMHGLEDFYWWFVARRVLAEEIVAGEVKGRKSARILDIGCGTGANMKAFSRHGDTVGVDASMEALSLCRTRGLDALSLSNIEELPFSNETFDVITGLDILEHTDDDLIALREVRRVAKPDALILITVPAYGFLWSEHDEALKHRRRYTAHELRNKLTVSGFDVVRTSYFITALFFPILGLRIWQGLLKKSTHPKTSIQVLPAWINSSLVGLLAVERKLFNFMNLPFGVSIVALARPQQEP